MPLFELLIDGFLAALLVITIAYCWVLNGRIRVLQDSRSDLARLLRHFDESTQRASETIAQLQASSKRMGDTIQSRMEQAIFAADDLNFLIDRAEKISDQLEAGINIGRSARRVQDELAATPQPQRKPAKPANGTESKPARAADAKPAPKEKEVPPASKPSPLDSLQAMIEKIAARTVSDPAARSQRQAKAAESRARSRVEQELLEIIRAGKG